MMNQYYNGLIHTDLVIPEVPQVPYTYDDFASTVIVLGLATGTSGLKFFKESSQDSPERKLYNQLLHRNVTIGNGLPVRKPYWATNMLDENFYKQLYRLRKYHVTIGNQIDLTSLLTRVCWAKVYSQAPELQKINPHLKSYFSPKFKNLYPWTTSDPETHSKIYAFLKRKAFIPDKKISKRVKRSIEHGMYQRIIWTMETLDFAENFFNKIMKINIRSTQMKNCKKFSTKLKIKEVGFENLKVVNFQKFSAVFLVLFSVCYMALIIECYIYTYTYRE